MVDIIWSHKVILLNPEQQSSPYNGQYVEVSKCAIKTPIYTGTETDTHAHCIPGRVAGRNDLSYIVNNGKTHCK